MVASAARAARGGPTAVDGSLASFLPRLPILPYVGRFGHWDESLKPGHNGQFVREEGYKIGKRAADSWAADPVSRYLLPRRGLR